MERLSSNIYFFFQNLQSFDDMLSKTNMVMIGEEISSVLIIFAFFIFGYYLSLHFCVVV